MTFKYRMIVGFSRHVVRPLYDVANALCKRVNGALEKEYRRLKYVSSR